MKLDLDEELVDAREAFKNAEKEKNPDKKSEELENGVDILDSYIEEHPNAPGEIIEYITNLRRSYTRRLVEQLLLVNYIEFNTWCKYYIILFTRLKVEIDYERAHNLEFDRRFIEFDEKKGDDGKSYKDILIGLLNE